MSPDECKRLSKYLSLVLRHEPGKIGIALDDEGFVPLADFLASLRRKGTWSRVTEAMVREVVETNDKQRFEIVDCRIRARYGHSIAHDVLYDEVEPPAILYHGTSPGALTAIRTEGLRPMNRQYVHLSTEIDQARAVGARHASRPVVLTVRARDAHSAGAVKFYRPEQRLLISTPIPPEFIDFPA